MLRQLEQTAHGSDPLRIQALNVSDITAHLFEEVPDVILFLGPKWEEIRSVEPNHSDLLDVFHASQCLMKKAWGTSVRIYYLYEGVSSWLRLDCEALSGFLRSAMMENEHHVWTCIRHYHQDASQTRYQLLLKEWLSDESVGKSPASFSEVRYEKAERLVHQLIEANLNQSACSVFRSRGTYLITGGLGPVGELLCQELAKRYQATLVILSRGRWDEKKQEQCQELETLGARVHYHSVDITDQTALQKTYTRIKQEVSVIHGVIHLARRVEDGSIVSKPWDSFERVIQAKVQGTMNLDTLTADEPLGFFMLFSSMAAFGIRGSSDYGYSAAFQNAFAYYRNQLRVQEKRSGVAIAQNWGAWTVDKYMPANRNENLKAAGFDLIDMESAFPWIEASCFCEESVIRLMAVDDPTKVKSVTGCQNTAQGDQKVSGRTFQSKSVPQKPIQTERVWDISQIIRETFAEALKLKTIDENQPFQSYSLDSISGMQVAVRLEKKLDQQIQPGWFIDFSMVQTLSRHLMKQDDYNKKHLLEPEKNQTQAVEMEPSISNRQLFRSKKARARFASAVVPKERSQEPIAIVGLSGYLLQSMSVHEFWDALDHDHPLIEEIPSMRFDGHSIYDATGEDHQKSRTEWGGFIPDIRGFDPRFFNILPSEADLVDPRQRLLLMLVYHTLEGAGYAPASLQESQTGVFIGVEENEYAQNLMEGGIDPGDGFGQAASMVANRISYFFDFRGPSEFVNTMCSGAAVALHRAVGALRSGEIMHAVVGAANLILRPDPFIFFSRSGQLSPDQTVHSFGKNANGYLRAEGVASAFLKPLSKAETDGDAIYGVIKNTAVNYNGQGVMSIAAPNRKSHADLIQKCYQEVNIDPRDVTYIEAQGMGNPVADIAEWEACNRALQALAKEQGVDLSEGRCRISTLKPMMGHIHAASALGALFKIIRSFQTNKIHKILNFEELNPDLDTEKQPCRLATETEAWPKGKKPRLTGLHSYGSGGNNAHLLIEEYDRTLGSPVALQEPVALMVSAKTATQRRALTQHLVEFIEKRAADDLNSLAYTLKVGRDAMPYRVVFVAEGRDQWLRQARAYLSGILQEGVFEGCSKEERGSFSGGSPQDLAVRWTQGYKVVDEVNRAARRLHLPVYPFATETYWIETPKVGKAIEHPFGGTLFSDDEGRTGFNIRFTGAEFFLDQHRVRNRKIFPGMGYLEMARAAVERISGQPVTRLSHITWQDPLFVDDQPLEVRIKVKPECGEDYAYQVASGGNRQGSGIMTHGKGKVSTSALPAAPLWNLEEIKQRCPDVVDGGSLYDRLDTLGLNYGLRFRGVRTCYVGGSEAVALIRSAAQNREGEAVFCLHPALLDSSLHAALAWGLEIAEGRFQLPTSPRMDPSIPFSLREILIYEKLPEEFHVYIRSSEEAMENVHRVDVDLCAENGRTLVSLRGFYSR